MKRGSLRSKSALAGVLVALAQVQGLLAQDPCLTLGIPVWTNSQVQFTLTGESSVSYVIESSPDLVNWSPVFTNTDFNPTRTITNAAPTDTSLYRARRGPLPVFAGALTAQQGFDLLCHAQVIDSFDSADTNYSTLGLYDPTKRKAGGDVAAEQAPAIIGNLTIHGVVRTGPTTWISIGPNGLVGDLNWLGPGIEPGWTANNFRFCLPDVSSPAGALLWPLVPLYTGPPINGQAYQYVFPTSGDFTVPSVTGSVLIGTNASVRLRCTSTINIASTNQVAISPGGSLKIYMEGPTASIGGKGVVNQTGNAANFFFFGLPSNTNLTCSCTNTFIGAVYAPQAAVSLNGASSTTTNDFVGSCVAHSIVLNTNLNVHFDEYLKRAGPMR